MQKLEVNQLEVGMKVVKLDRKWFDTPFITHNFVIKSEKQLVQLRNSCDFAFIEQNLIVPVPDTNFIPYASQRKAGIRVISRSFKLLNAVFVDLENSSYLNSYKVQLIVHNLTVQVLSDSKTYEYLNIIKSDAPCIAQKSVRVLILYLTLCKYLGIKKDKLLHLGCAALLHDVGMVCLPIAYDKPDELTQIEKKYLVTHTSLGVKLIEKTSGFPSIVSKTIKSHHEHYNGSGYPSGLSKRNINLYSRMLTLVCTYEAITRNRKYKTALNTRAAVTELARVSGAMLDPRLVAKFIEVMGEFPNGTTIRTVNNKVVKVIKKLEEEKYLVLLISPEDSGKSLVVDSNLFEEVIYE